MSFRLKTILGIALIELTVMAVLILINQANYGGTASAQLYERVRATGGLFATLVADAVISTDLATLDAMIENALSNEQLVYLRVTDQAGITLSEGGDRAVLDAPFILDPDFESALSDHRIDLSTGISVSGQGFGTVQIGVSTLPVEVEMARALRWNLLIAVFGMLLVALFGYVLGSVLTRQLSRLRHGARMIARGNLTYQIDASGRDELADTARCFNSMAATLQSDRAALIDKQAILLERKGRVETIVQSMTQISQGVLCTDIPDGDRTDEIGDMARATMVFQDAMQQVRTAQAAQARLIRAFDQLDEQVAIFDTDGRAIFANGAFRLFNDDILETLPADFRYCDFLDRGLSLGAFPGAVGQEQAWRARRLSREETLPSEIARAPDRTLMKRHTHVPGIGSIVSASDVTELRTSQAQLVQASKLATLGEMATGIAHELNQPLGVIRMASNNCLKRIERGQADTDYLTAKLQRMADQTERASQIINHMRIFGRTASDETRAFDLVASLASACGLVQEQLLLDGVRLESRVEPEQAWVLGQQVMFEQVMLNLINNGRDAILSASPDRADGCVRITLAQARAGGFSISVHDNGGGVPEAVLDRLFDPFFTTKDPGKGTGLGLSISYGIIRDMGGVISVVNAGGGARFTLELPQAEARDESDAA